MLWFWFSKFPKTEEFSWRDIDLCLYYCWLKLDVQTNGFMLLQRADTLHLWTTKCLALLMCLALWVIFTISHIRFDYKISSNRRFIALLLSNMNWRRSRHDWWLSELTRSSYCNGTRIWSIRKIKKENKQIIKDFILNLVSMKYLNDDKNPFLWWCLIGNELRRWSTSKHGYKNQNSQIILHLVTSS